MPAYVDGYKNDIFISYNHVDNRPVQGIGIGWVSYLVDTLENILDQNIGLPNQFKIFMDIKQGMNQMRLTTEIEPNVRRSATFLIILSPGFLSSKWCEQELNYFLEDLKMDDPNSMRRIFIAEKTSYRVTLPPSLKDAISYRFHYTDEQARIRTRGWPMSQPDEKKYFNKVQDIAYDLVDELDHLKGK